ncbi:MAG: hypothetical protein ACFLMY_00190 [Candidatus Brachytrichaceae bacterium NZ_4S206]|jgi:endonuclease G
MSTKKKTHTPTIEDAYREALAKYAHRENVTGIDVGYKYTNGERTGTLAVRIHVLEKIPELALEASEIFPEEILGFPVDVIQADYKPLWQLGAEATTTDRRARLAQLQPGISIGHPGITVGTLGMIVRDKRSGRPAILSNWHVLAGSNAAAPGDPILQPGPHDGGRAPRDAVGALERMMLNEDGDAAIALIAMDTRPFSPEILDLDIAPDSLADPNIDDLIVKSGRTTGVTRGRVDGKGRYFISYPSVGRVGIAGFNIVPREPGNPSNEEISSGGDSGSVWLKEGTTTVVGLHFAGEQDPRPSEERALACYATRVFDGLQIELLSASPPDAHAPGADGTTGELTVERLWIELPPTPATRLRANIRFRLPAPATQLAESTSPYFVHFATCNLASGDARVVATAHARLRAGQSDYSVSGEFETPPSGRYQLFGAVAIPDRRLAASSAGPLLRVE